ncbi:unnamed protein product [marine sediment metagenome]|uniref:Uncharacterized protein n=1 Tax=marine sediment metagenome TaxID=412755 RepID=X1I200_9ZZZZ
MQAAWVIDYLDYASANVEGGTPLNLRQWLEKERLRLKAIMDHEHGDATINWPTPQEPS